MEASAVEAVGADDAEGLARRTGLAVLLFPLFEQGRWRVGAAGTDELIAERVGNVRVGQSADAALHFFPLVARKHQLLIRRSMSTEDHRPYLNRACSRKRRRNKHVRSLVCVRLRYRHRNRNRPFQL